MDSTQGLWRAPAHFTIWCAVPNIAGYVMFETGVPVIWLAVSSPILLIAFQYFTISSEVRDFRRGVQTFGKAIIDYRVKLAGFVFGLVSWSWFYM